MRACTTYGKICKAVARRTASSVGGCGVGVGAAFQRSGQLDARAFDAPEVHIYALPERELEDLESQRRPLAGLLIGPKHRREPRFRRLCYPGPIMEQIRVVYEEFKVLGKELVDKVGQLIHAGNVRRIIVKDDKGNTFMEIPLTLATVGVVAAPVLAGLGAIAVLIANFTLVVERVKEDTTEVGPEDARSGDA